MSNQITECTNKTYCIIEVQNGCLNFIPSFAVFVRNRELSASAISDLSVKCVRAVLLTGDQFCVGDEILPLGQAHLVPGFPCSLAENVWWFDLNFLSLTPFSSGSEMRNQVYD